MSHNNPVGNTVASDLLPGLRLRWRYYLCVQRLSLAPRRLCQLVLNETSFICDKVGNCIISKISLSDLKQEGDLLIVPFLDQAVFSQAPELHQSSGPAATALKERWPRGGMGRALTGRGWSCSGLQTLVDKLV